MVAPDVPRQRSKGGQPPEPPEVWLDQLVNLLDLAYEAAFDLADQAEADFETIGQPLDRALHLVAEHRP